MKRGGWLDTAAIVFAVTSHAVKFIPRAAVSAVSLALQQRR
jgi:hypothetical protein